MAPFKRKYDQYATCSDAEGGHSQQVADVADEEQLSDNAFEEAIFAKKPAKVMLSATLTCGKGSPPYGWRRDKPLPPIPVLEPPNYFER